MCNSDYAVMTVTESDSDERAEASKIGGLVPGPYKTDDEWRRRLEPHQGWARIEECKRNGRAWFAPGFRQRFLKDVGSTSLKAKANIKFIKAMGNALSESQQKEMGMEALADTAQTDTEKIVEWISTMSTAQIKNMTFDEWRLFIFRFTKNVNMREVFNSISEKDMEKSHCATRKTRIDILDRYTRAP